MSRMSGRFRTMAGQRGLAMVEFVIGLPILLLLLLGIFEVGRMLSEYNRLTMATRDAARYVARNAVNPTLGSIELSSQRVTEAKNLLVYNSPVASVTAKAYISGLQPGDVQISTLGSEHIQVSVTYQFTPTVVNSIPGFFGDAIPLQVPLTATVIMRAM